MLAQKHVHEQGMKRQITGPEEQVLTWGPHHVAQGPSDVDNGILAEVTGENLVKWELWWCDMEIGKTIHCIFFVIM